MIGFSVTKEMAQTANETVELAQTSRGLPVFWIPGQYTIYSGDYAGLTFVPCDEQILHTPLRGSPPLTPIDFPEFAQVIEELGGMGARVTISPFDLIQPE